MADRDIEQDVLLREIDEDLRQEQMAKLWRKYGNWVIGGAVALVVAVAGYQGWRSYDVKSRQVEGEQLALALRQARNQETDEAIGGLAKLAGEARNGYAMLALFQEGALTARKGDAKGAALIFGKIAADGRFETPYRDLATLLAVLQDMDGGEPSALAQRLASLIKEDSPWRFSARELNAALSLRAGDPAAARQAYEKLSKDPQAPQGVRARATEMAAVLTR